MERSKFHGKKIFFPKYAEGPFYVKYFAFEIKDM